MVAGCLCLCAVAAVESCGLGGRVVAIQVRGGGRRPAFEGKALCEAFLCSANQRRDACGTGRYRDARDLQQCDANAAILQPCRAQAARVFLHAAIAQHDCWRAEQVTKASSGCGRRVAVGTHLFSGMLVLSSWERRN